MLSTWIVMRSGRGTEGSSNGSSTPASSDGVSIDSRREAYIQSMQSETRVFVRECLNRIVGILLDQFPLRVELRYQEIINVCLFESIYGEFFLGRCPDRCHASLFTCCQKLECPRNRMPIRPDISTHYICQNLLCLTAQHTPLFYSHAQRSRHAHAGTSGHARSWRGCDSNSAGFN